MTDDLTLMHLMCAKLCHDLAAPAGAVTMGLEMLAEAPLDLTTRNLVHFSAQSTISKLELFRCLTGYAGMTNKPTGTDVENTLKNYWHDGKLSVIWKTSDLNALQGPPARLLLATLLMAADGLPRGGTLMVEPDLSITARGPAALIREDVVCALSEKSTTSQQTASTIVAYFAKVLAEGVGRKFQIIADKEDEFQIQLVC
jgi:histidine phosphotransferase ChpT